ncbi:hypothetical protein BDZ94DRAFT_1316168 [Collybia nuda]|uniref:Uncharacterized protein n=1 Tax=Collybia nuda TaxID=64659 RepID=A0A9P6C7T7_9AGAR|nr:hypothetical protein BDZ94DRAFT_1316168 [Collybia nuda]
MASTNTTYTLHVDLDNTQLNILQNSGFSLCIAKKVNNMYNVVWNSTSFIEKNTFQWTEDYALFGQVGFTSSALISAATNILPIEFRQTADFDSNGIFQDPQDSSGDSSFSVDNNYGPINFGVQAKLGGIFAPVYLDATPEVLGQESFTPVVSVMVWFDRTLSTSTMFTSSLSRAFEIDYTGIISQTVSYVTDANLNYGIWVFGDPTSGQELQYTPHKIYHPLTNIFKDPPFANDRNVIRSLLNQYLSFSAGELPQPSFLVQATVILPPSGDAKGAVAFLKAFLPMGVEADFKIPDDQAAGPNKVIIARLAWNKLVEMKTLIAGGNDVGKLEQLFKYTLNVYDPGYLSLKNFPLN